MVSTDEYADTHDPLQSCKHNFIWCNALLSELKHEQGAREA